MPKSKNSNPAPARKVGGIQLAPAADLSSELFHNKDVGAKHAGEIELEHPNSALIAFDDKDRLQLPEEMPEDELRAQWAKAVESTFPDLSEEKRSSIVNYGLREYSSEVELRTFLEQSAKQPHTPMKWADAPSSMKFEEFMRLEYVAKGVLNRPGFDLLALREMDQGLAKAYYKQHARKTLPADIIVPKHTAHTNKRERGEKAP